MNIFAIVLAVVTLLALAWPLALEPEPNHRTLVRYVSGVATTIFAWIAYVAATLA